MKNILKYGAISVIAIGLFFGKYLGRWIINMIDNSDTRVNNGKPYIGPYLSNCQTLNLLMNDFVVKDSYFEVQGTFDISKDDNSAYLDKYETIFFEKGYSKYFCIYYFFSMNSMYSQMYGQFINDIDKNGTKIIALVNKNELIDPSYGTKDKPIPITYYEAPEKMTTLYELNKGPAENSFSFHGTEDEFKTLVKNNNVRNYLSYVKSKADFEKMFGKQPDK